jgi:hypothetical protein
MKKNIYPQNQSQTPGSAPQPISPMTPSSDEVARRAYFTYVNQGSPDGCDVQHWLTAEAELIAERNLTRVHGFHNKT